MSIIRPAPPETPALTAATKGAYCYLPSGYVPIVPVDVTGVTPTEGTVMCHNLDTGVVSEVAGATVVTQQPGDAFDYVIMQSEGLGVSEPSVVVVLSAVPAGGFFMLSGDLYRRVVVTGHDPDSGKVWTHELTTGTVAQMADTTEVERRPGSPVEWVLKYV